MAATPIIARWNDVENTSLELPGFRQRSMRTVTEGQLIRFESDVAPRDFRSEALYRIWSVEALFNRFQTVQAQQLITMLQAAAQAADRRLYFDHGGLFADVIPFGFAVVCHEWRFQMHRAGTGIMIVQFELTEVSA